MGGELSVAEEERGRRHGARLAEVTIDHDPDVTIASRDVKKLDSDCFTAPFRSPGNRSALRRSRAADAPAGEIAGLEAVGEEAGVGLGEGVGEGSGEVVGVGVGGGLLGSGVGVGVGGRVVATKLKLSTAK